MTSQPDAVDADVATPSVPADTPSTTVPEPSSTDPAADRPKQSSPTAQPERERFPDQITGGRPRGNDDRPPPAVSYRPPPAAITYRPHPGEYAARPPATLMPLSSRNGPAKASLLLILLGVLGSAAARWLIDASDAFVELVNLISTALLVAAFILAIAGLFIAVSRPTKKSAAVIALVSSSLLLLGIVVLYALRIAAGSSVASEAVEADIAGWYLSTSGAIVTVDCPVDPPTADGATFLCSATHGAGNVEVVQVTVQGESFTWQVMAG
jgi:hypothetical protein